MTVEWTGEATQAAKFLANLPEHRHTTLEAADLRSLLLNTGGQLLARGSLYDINSKALGAGVYRVSLTRWNGP